MTETVGNNAAAQLRAYIERVERLEEEKAGVAADIKEVYAEAKATGFDTKVLREVIKIRKMNPADRNEQQQKLALYLDAIGTGELYEGGARGPSS